MLIWIVVPAYNESSRIGPVLRGLFQQGYNNVVVVDDGSNDDTALAARTANAKMISHLVRRGQGAALQTGNEFVLARGADVVVHFDGDGQFDAGDIKGAIEFLQKNDLAVVLGSKMLDGRSKIPLFKKYFIIPVGRALNFLMTGAWLTDVHNGFRVLARAAAQQIEITQDGMAHNSEIVGKIKKLKLPFAEYPVKVVYNEYGQGAGGGVKILWDWLVSLFIK